MGEVRISDTTFAALRGETSADMVRALSRHASALRRVNQDWTAFGAVERTNERRLADARREVAWLAVFRHGYPMARSA